MKTICLLLISCGLYLAGQAQDLSKMFEDSTAGHQPVIGTFKSTRIIMGHSNETLKKHELDFRVAHRFGDIGGSFGGGKTAFGLDNSTDIRIAFEYGITDDLMVGISRAKGSGDLSQVFEGLAKYRVLKQTTDDQMPVSLSVFGNVTLSTMTSSIDETSASHFEEFTDRMTYVAQAIIARKFGDRLSLTLSPTYVHRNRVGYMDMNNMFALGGSGRIRLSKRLAFIAEYYYPFRSQSSKDYYKAQGIEFFNPLGAGLEIETGGHVFSVNFTNSTAILENQFIPETRASWLQGQFRWGFNISRRFSLFSKKDWKK
ncbi:DUF5777 family beta-barrel protein [Chitinophaga japonensis]|uniref:DUF5777 domain-containing protein n=1 Tax=Chitinophaga japonensis TaxID=104662 RepID=A0A562TCI6_CHIJA|nr:DUF5777 family beta-barrel protein [Chitinophaga japonensis]TWI91229.1 hypothetical protein LX66_0594 [Chitinophaga japonensis]